MGMNPTDSELRAWWKVTDKNSECSDQYNAGLYAVQLFVDYEARIFVSHL